jgi:FtsZ-binding cell division protein ZapB
VDRIEEIRDWFIKTDSLHYELCSWENDAIDNIKYLLEQVTALQEENAALKSDLLNGSLTGYEAMKREITTLKDYNHALKVANDTTYENYKKLEQHNATLTKALDGACDDMANGCTWMDGSVTKNSLIEYYAKQARSTINSKEGEQG